MAAFSSRRPRPERTTACSDANDRGARPRPRRERGLREPSAVSSGRRGNSGHASGPHLHIHVCDAPSDLRCEGLPFVFERYEARTYEPIGDSIETARFQGSSTAVTRLRQLPAAERMLAF